MLLPLQNLEHSVQLVHSQYKHKVYDVLQWAIFQCALKFVLKIDLLYCYLCNIQYSIA